MSTETHQTNHYREQAVVPTLAILILIAVAAFLSAVKSHRDITNLRRVVSEQQQTIALCAVRFDRDITNLAVFAWSAKDAVDNLRTNLLELDGVVAREIDWNMYTLTNLAKFAERCQHARFSNQVDIFILPIPRPEQPAELKGHIL